MVADKFYDFKNRSALVEAVFNQYNGRAYFILLDTDIVEIIHL